MRKALPIVLLLSAALLLVFAPVALLGQTAAPPVSNQYQHIKNTWSAPNSTYPDCSATVTSSCLNTYTFSAAPPSGSGGATAIVTVANGGIAAGGPVTYVWGPGGYLYCGTWNISVVANYLDSTGATVSSTANPATVAVPCPLVASPVAGLIGTPAP